jgi:signal transduction histidine kinase
LNHSPQERKTLIGFGDDEVALVREAGALIAPDLDDIVDAFYAHMTTHAPLRDIISRHTTTDRLKQTFKAYLTSLFSGDYAGGYDTHRIQVGLTHDRVGLPLMWYLGMFGHLERLLFDHLEPHYRDRPLKDWRRMERAIGDLIKYDQLLAVDAYVDAYTGKLREETRTAESARKAKSLFLATVSHELRTPLSSILGYTDLILDTSKEISPQTRQHLQVLHRNAENLLGMINGLIEIGKVGSGGWQSQIVDGSVRALLDDMATNAEGLVVGKPVFIDRRYSPKTTANVSLDFSKLRQVLLNLVSNACKFTDDGKVSLDFIQTDSLVTIMVSDTGPGIPTDQHEKVFVEFYRMNTETAKKPGSGLGLALVKSLVDSMRGAISIEPNLPRGTMFKVSIPI